MAPSSFWVSMRRSRASRFWYSGWSARRSSSPKSVDVSAPLGLRPLKYSSSAPGFDTGSQVGLGMNRLIRPPTSSRDFPLIWAHCMPRLANCGSMCRVKASGAS